MDISRRLLLAGGAMAFMAPADVHAATETDKDNKPMNALSDIKQIDYTVIFARDLPAMRRFYEDVLQFPISRALGEGWIEYRVGANVLALTVPGVMFDAPLAARDSLSLQLAFRVAPDKVKACAEELEKKGVVIERPVTDQPWGHRTIFFRDPDGNIIEIYAEI